MLKILSIGGRLEWVASGILSRMSMNNKGNFTSDSEAKIGSQLSTESYPRNLVVEMGEG